MSRHPHVAHREHAAARQAPAPHAPCTAAPHAPCTPVDSPLPSLHVSHDAPPLLDPVRMRELRALGEEGLLVVGSGSLPPGLRHVDRRRPDVVPGWSADVDARAAGAPARGEVEELAHARTRAPGTPCASPTVEHCTPLFVTLGAAPDPEAGVRTTVDGYVVGLSTRSSRAA